jgi:hypothetical protein
MDAVRNAAPKSPKPVFALCPTPAIASTAPENWNKDNSHHKDTKDTKKTIAPFVLFVSLW